MPTTVNTAAAAAVPTKNWSRRRDRRARCHSKGSAGAGPASSASRVISSLSCSAMVRSDQVAEVWRDGPQPV